ncbi:MAG: helix-turn-helix transcriptional regulator [Thermoleophilia bacterium]|nr:helix-turn-helix transcriptional regulator [Thermoleophilia bacterium]MDH5334577.1 helix-turn-helix transcriptional regulator [Thermoleophilia bacterium]
MRAEAIKGHVDLLVLSVLQRSPAHGYAVAERLRKRSSGVFDLAEGTIYPALYRLEGQGLVESRWRTVGGRRRRVYRLTTAGEQALSGRRRHWDAFATAMQAVLS